MGRRTINLPVDDRTEDMSDEALVCRSRGHKWAERAVTRKRFNETLLLGFIEEFNYCENGCGSVWERTFDLNGDMLEQKRKHPSSGYLVPTGQGRLSRQAARVARLARRYQQLAYA